MTKISGYREPSPLEIDTINDIKALGPRVEQMITLLQANTTADPRCLAIARTEIQTGFMWLTRAVMKPEGF